jgi:hypothetical protein
MKFHDATGQTSRNRIILAILFRSDFASFGGPGDRLSDRNRCSETPAEFPYPRIRQADMACSFRVPTFQKNPACRPLSAASALEGLENRSAIAERQVSGNEATEHREEARDKLRSPERHRQVCLWSSLFPPHVFAAVAGV